MNSRGVELMPRFADRAFHDRFFEKPALSFENQPDLQKFYEYLLDKERHFTFVLGAGLSLDAELPSWKQLVANIVRFIEPRWQGPALADDSDLLRKAESVINLAMENTGRDRDHLICDALYSSAHGFTSVPQSGRLTSELAKLVYALSNRAVVATTNFDTIFDRALNAHIGNTGSPIDSVALPSDISEENSAWTTSRAEWLDGKSILHLHGVLEINPMRTDGNVVLTETDFLRFGATVRDVIKERIINSHVVFVGVSLTDPNLVGPLWELATSGLKAGADYREPFLFSVASCRSNSPDPSSERAYEIRKSQYLANNFGVTTLFFKSYGQQTQAIAESALALSAPEEYLSDDSLESLRYGHRLKRTLEHCYTNIGCEPRSEMPIDEHATKLSDRLFDLMNAENGIVAMLHECREDHKSSNNTELREIANRFEETFKNEEFGLFLWLRSRNSTERSAAYELRLVGTSVYQHRAGWSLDRKADITKDRHYPSVEAAFYGRLCVQDFPETDRWQLWRSARAIPFSYYAGRGSSVDKLAALEVGVITLNSTMFAVSGDPDVPNTAPDQAIWPNGCKRSILSTLSISEAKRIDAELQRIAIEVVATPS